MYNYIKLYTYDLSTITLNGITVVKEKKIVGTYSTLINNVPIVVCLGLLILFQNSKSISLNCTKLKIIWH